VIYNKPGIVGRTCSFQFVLHRKVKQARNQNAAIL